MFMATYLIRFIWYNIQIFISSDLEYPLELVSNWVADEWQVCHQAEIRQIGRAEQWASFRIDKKEAFYFFT